MKKILIFVGPPGSGKGTQAKKVATKYNYKHVSTGDLIRALSSDSDITEREKEILHNVNFEGQLAPDWFICGMVFREIERFLEQDEYLGMVFDGAVRTLEQAQRINQFLETKDLISSSAVVGILISNEVAFNRLTKRRICSECRNIVPWSDLTKDLVKCDQCGGDLVVRPDDKEETIKIRIKEQGNTALAPILDYYRNLDLLIEIDGEKNIQEVEKLIEKSLVK